MVHAMGPGAGWFDCNNDSYLDLCYLAADGEIVLLIFDPNLDKFVDHSATAIPVGIQRRGSGMSVLCGDVNNDGWTDLFFTFDGSNRLLLNERDNTFRPVSRPAGIVSGVEGDVLSASAAFLDFDSDGLLDIFVANYEGHANQFFHNLGIDQDGLPHFTDIAPALGMDLAANGQSDWGLGVAVGDYDNDGDVDIYVANDYDGAGGGRLLPGPNILYRNEGNGTFADVTYDAGAAADSGWAMGVAFGDYDQDGWLDLFIANFWEDTLLRNNQDGTFTNVTVEVEMPTAREECFNGWGTTFLDYDNDGDLDIHVTNGYISNDQGQVANEPDQLWENRSPAQGLVYFADVAPGAGIDNLGDGRGAAYADFNRDGFIDFVVFNNNYVTGHGDVPVPRRIMFVNQGNGTYRDLSIRYGFRDSWPDSDPLTARGDFSANAWIEVRPIGTVSNRDGFGSRVTVEADGRTWIQDKGAGSYCSTNDPYLHFGLGRVDVIQRVTVRFPSGIEISRTNVPINAVLSISEDGSTPVRLLDFGVAQDPEGALVRWRFVAEEDLAAFSLTRGHRGIETVLAPSLKARGEEGEFLDNDVPENELLVYGLDAIYRDGTRERLGIARFRYVSPPWGALGQSFPNPFVSATSSPVYAPPGGHATVQIFDVSGRLVRILRGGPNAGTGVLRWDGLDESGRPVPPGAYFYGEGTTKKMFKIIRRQ